MQPFQFDQIEILAFALVSFLAESPDCQNQSHHFHHKISIWKKFMLCERNPYCGNFYLNLNFIPASPQVKQKPNPINHGNVRVGGLEQI
jgi:hypothetical protein